MKKFCLLLLCFGLTACDNNGVIGKCVPNTSSTTTTEQNGKVIEIKTTVRYMCGCFENKESDLPDFGPSNEEFSFETTDKETVQDIEPVDDVEYKYIEKTQTETVEISGTESKTYANKVCDKQCTKWCKKNKK